MTFDNLEQNGLLERIEKVKIECCLCLSQELNRKACIAHYQNLLTKQKKKQQNCYSTA